MRNFILYLLIIVILGSCVTQSSKSRGSLSDAMDKARDDYPDEREVPDGDKDIFSIWDSDENDDYEEYEEYEPYEDDGDYEPLDLFYSFSMGKTSLAGPYFSSAASYEISLGYDEEKVGTYLYGGVTVLEENGNHNISESIENSWMLEGGLELRYIPLGSSDFFSPYILGRVGGMYLNWNFKNSLNEGDISNDSLGGLSLAAGLGINIINSKFLRLGVACKPRLYLYGGETYEGFYNDYFGVSGDVLISADIGFQF